MLADGGSYTLVGFGGSHNDFSGHALSCDVAERQGD